MKDLKEFKTELDVIELEERLEMVNIAAQEVESGSNTVCCCSDPK
ncbi:hypothetical protein [uncultured Tenacibaculum sp.]|nr:hypothetical protein [uncultured Tenacibaculum sp.]